MPKKNRNTKGKIVSAAWKLFYRQGYDDTTIDEIIFGIKKGTIHVCAETIYQLEKLTHINEDTLPKYIIRNRAFFASVLAAVVLTTGLSSLIENAPVVDDNSTSISQSDNDSYKVYRTYTVKSGDALYDLAMAANITQGELMHYNGLDSSIIHPGDHLYIPYIIDAENLIYATEVIEYEPGTDLNEICTQYHTTKQSLVNLNQEAWQNGEMISDTLLVPNFKSQQEINQEKSEKSHQYSNK